MNNQDQLSQEDYLEKMEAIERLANENVDEATIKDFLGLLNEDDKGLKNAAASFYIRNSNPLIPQYIIDYIFSENVELRNLAGEILVKKGFDAVDAILARLPLCENHDHVKFLIDVLGLIGDKKAEEQIINVLSSNEDENVILACVETLGSLKSAKALDPIISLFYKDDKYKAHVIEALGKIGSDRALEYITSNLDTEDELLLFLALESLGDIGTEKTFYELLSRMNDIREPATWPLLESIYKLKEKYELDLPFDEKMKKCVLETILNSEPKYQKIAAHLVTVFDDPEILFACMVIYGYDSELDTILHEKFLNNKNLILAKVHSLIDNQPENLSFLLSLIQNILQDDSGIINELGSFELQKLTESVSRCLNHQDENIRMASAETLYNLNPDSIILFLDTLVEDDNVWNRMRLLDMLSEINHPDVITALEKLSNDPDEMVKEKAIEIFNQKQYPTNIKIADK